MKSPFQSAGGRSQLAQLTTAVVVYDTPGEALEAFHAAEGVTGE